MTPRQFLDRLYDGRPPKVPTTVLPALRLNAGLTPADRESPFSLLPLRHQALLTLSNGLDMLSGSYRLFGLGAAAARDMVQWNESDTWKFAWGERAAPYFCFGESVLGNQYAYREKDMRAGAPGPVYELYAVTLYEITRYETFDAFLDQGFLNGVRKDAYHERIAQARRELGQFELDKHLAYMPSPLLAGGDVAHAQLMPMTARSHMIVNGDLWRQLAHRDSLAGLQRIEEYEDEEGRLRLRVSRFGTCGRPTPRSSVLHAFQNKSPLGIKTARSDIDLIARRLKVAEQDYEARYGKTKAASTGKPKAIIRGSGNVFADLGFKDAEERQTKLRLG